MIREPTVRPRIEGFLRAARAALPAGQKLGVAGFCWGGRYTALACGGDAPLVDFGFTAHPSLLGVPAEVEAVAAPLSLANGDDDEWMRAPDLARVRAILEAETKGGIHEVVVYEGATHGFAVRGDPKDPRQAEFGLRAEDQAVRWFQKQLA